MAEDTPDLELLDLPLLTAELGPRPSGPDALRFALELFEDRLGLPLPPIPRRFAGSLRTLGPAFFATRADPPDLYAAEGFLVDLACDPEDYLAFGQIGHGVNAWAMHYALVDGPLALYVQIPWGGAYADNALAGREVARAFARCAALITASRLAALPPEQRLVAVESGLASDSRWGLVPRACDAEALAAGLTADPAALDAALAWAGAETGTGIDWEPPSPTIWG